MPTRHPDLYFEDGNLSIVAGRQYFIVHRGLLCRHSEVLRVRIESIKANDDKLLEGLAVLYLDDSPEDLAHFLRALYGYDTLPYLWQPTTDYVQLISRQQRGRFRCHLRRSPPSYKLWGGDSARNSP